MHVYQNACGAIQILSVSRYSADQQMQTKAVKEKTASEQTQIQTMQSLNLKTTLDLFNKEENPLKMLFREREREREALNVYN